MAAAKKRDRVKRMVKAKQRYSDRHRLVVWRSSQHIYATIYSTSNLALFTASTLNKDVKSTIKKGMKKVEQAAVVGSHIAKMALDRGIKEVCFDRSGFVYHGRVAELARAAREAGLAF